MSKVAIRAFTAADRDWLVDQHSFLYMLSDGFDDSFGQLVGEIVDDFLMRHDTAHEAGWIAESAGRRLGSIFCVRQDHRTAKLRLFLLVPEVRGLGLGRRMLQTCMDFAETCGYPEMHLWTHESHSAACALYLASGWHLESSRPVTSFGRDLVEQHWRYRF